MKRTLTAVVLGFIALISWAAITANAGFQLEYAEGVEHDAGMAVPVTREVSYYVPPAPRAAPRVRAQPVAAPASGADFWRRLANCESPDGRSGYHTGYFQFSPDTARKVGIDGSESYEEQRAAAQSWASQVNPGTTAGWPVCWWRAQ